MHEKKEILKNIAVATLSTGLAITTQGSSNLILGALSGIAGGIASDFLQKNDFNKIIKLLSETDPSDLNHDLQKLVVKAVEWSILNIQILYKKQLTEELQIKELNTFTKKLIEEISLLNGILSEKDGSIYQVIEKPKNNQEIFDTFDIDVNRLPIINKDKPYNEFFKKHFKSNLQLCFGELLKNDKYKPALIAYQREIYSNLDSNIAIIIKQNEQILNKLSNNQQNKHIVTENEKWEKVSSKIKQVSFNDVNPDFENLLSEHFLSLKQDTELLIDITSDIQSELAKVKGVTKDFGKELKQNWINKNKVKILSSFAVIILFVIALLLYIYAQPFQMNIGVTKSKNIEVQADYPKLSNNAKLRIYLPKETIEKEITFNNEIILNNLPKEIKNQKFKIELIDDYWKLEKDSLQLNTQNKLLNIKPNNRLAKVFGVVKSDNLQGPIANAKVQLLTLATKTDSLGRFSFIIPIKFRKPEYTIRITKKGYNTKEKYCVPQDKVEILLSKNN